MGLDNGSGTRIYLLKDGTLSLIKQVNPAGDCAPSEFAQVGNKVFFVADNGTSGLELWVTDGLDNGTAMVKDINAGTAGSDPYNLTSLDGKLYFNANDGTNGIELWVSDGTASGTRMVKDINPAGDGNPQEIPVAFGGKYYFSVDDGTNGFELWRTDGLDNGTEMVKDINTGALAGSNPTSLVVFQGKLFFTADDGVSGPALWSTDGTPGGTSLVKPVSMSSPILVNDTLYFIGNDGINGNELWKSDGTPTGTAMVKDLNGTAAADGIRDTLTAYRGKVYFSGTTGTGGWKLFASDGTLSGTTLVKDIYPGGTSAVRDLAVSEDVLYFSAIDNTNGRQLWSTTDGTDAGTRRLTAVNAPGAGWVNVRSIQFPGNDGAVAVSGSLGAPYIVGNDGVHGLEIWVLDSSAEGARLLVDFNLAGDGFVWN